MLLLELTFWLSVFVIVYHMALHPVVLVAISRKLKTEATATKSNTIDAPAVDVIMPMYLSLIHI